MKLRAFRLKTLIDEPWSCVCVSDKDYQEQARRISDQLVVRYIEFLQEYTFAVTTWNLVSLNKNGRLSHCDSDGPQTPLGMRQLQYIQDFGLKLIIRRNDPNRINIK